jgi:hypothetical protein
MKMFSQLAQAYPTYSTSPAGSSSGPGAVAVILYFAIIILAVVGLWKLFTKAGQPGWASIIPIYNTYILLKIAGKPGWWVLLTLIPFVNIAVSIIAGIEIAKRFGYSSGFGAIVCGILGIGYLIIAFGNHTYNVTPAAV